MVGVAMIRQSGVNITIITPLSYPGMLVVVLWYLCPLPTPPLQPDIFPRLSLTPDLHYLIINATAGIPLITPVPSPQCVMIGTVSWSPVSSNIKTILNNVQQSGSIPGQNVVFEYPVIEDKLSIMGNGFTAAAAASELRLQCLSQSFNKSKATNL